MSPVLRDTTIIPTILNSLEPLEPNTYTIALSTGSDQFIGSPNGYKALPWDVTPDSFFFKLELISGECTYRIGTHRPPALEEFLKNSTKSKTYTSHLWIWFGASDSFVARSKTVWICSKVPPQLTSRLRQMSSYSCTKYNATKGVFKDGTLDDVQWHSNGSFYAKKGDSDHVIISPYLEKGETFAFIKKTEPGKEPPFIIHFEWEQRHSNLIQESGASKCSTLSASPLDRDLDRMAASNSFDENNATTTPKRYPQLENLDSRDFRFAISKTCRRPTNDLWDLDLNKGEKLLVLRDMGRGWHIAMKKKGLIGWVHGSWN
ncbi:hypothetical protein GGP41_000288 [Bipolaris sorokiniana]|uniref:SH3 domain-containing protein n=1 Tax=Cochliobolus sativus TaxID=45130 RepID=A0A8H5ZC38_COCSA|nr:hypothetical protein GGP41_000288 [Bipolaris sorokiniana]